MKRVLILLLLGGALLSGCNGSNGEASQGSCNAQGVKEVKAVTGKDTVICNSGKVFTL
jgi:hypothetical protein